MTVVLEQWIPIPFTLAGSSTVPVFHLLRVFGNVVLRPILVRPTKTVPQLAQSASTTPSTTLGDDGRWFPYDSPWSSHPTPEPTPFVSQTVLPKAATPLESLNHLPHVLSSDPTRAVMLFTMIVTCYLLVQFFARHIQLRRCFSPVTHFVSTAIIVYTYTLVGPASHHALLNIPVTLQQAKDSALPVTCAALAAFSIFNMLISVVDWAIFIKDLAYNPFILVPICYVNYPLVTGNLAPFEVTVRREIQSRLASVDPRFVAIVTMAFVALCVLDMFLGSLQMFDISLLGLSVSTLTCGPVVLVCRTFQTLASFFLRHGPFRRLTDSLILSTAHTFGTWASCLMDEVEPASLYDSDDSSTDVSSTRGTRQGETGLADAARLADASELKLISALEKQVLTQQADLGKRDSEISQLKLRIEEMARTHSRQQSKQSSTARTAAARNAKIAVLQSRIEQVTRAAKTDRKTIEKLKETRTRPNTEAGVQTLPVVFADATTSTTVPAPIVERVESGVQVDQVAFAERSVQVDETPRVLVDASTQHNLVLVDAATQTTETPRVLVDFSVQAQEPPRQVTEVAVQAAVALANSTTQTDDPPPTVPVAEHEQVRMELEELRRRLQDAESKREELEVTHTEEEAEEVHDKQEAHEQGDASIQLPNGGPQISIHSLAIFLGAKLNQAFAPQVVDSIPQDEGEENEEVEAEGNLHDSPNDSNLAPVPDTIAPIPNVSPDMYATYETIAGKKFTIPPDPDTAKLDRMPMCQWIMAALQRLYVDRLSNHTEVVESQVSEQFNTAATQALGQGNHTLMIAMWQLAQAHTLSKMSPEEAVKGPPAPAYVTVDWKRKKPMDDDRIGQSFYKLQRHVLDAIREKTTPNAFVVSALNLMEFSIAYAERLYADIKEPEWFKNSSNPQIRKARLWIKQETGVWVMDEDLIALAELVQSDWDLSSSFKRHLGYNDEQEPGYALLQIRRGMELEISIAEEAGEQPLAGAEEKKPKKRSDGVWGHEMAHYSNKVEEECDEPSVNESIDEGEEAEGEGEVEVTPEPEPAAAQPLPEVMAPPVETQTIQPLEEPELEQVPVQAAYTEEEKGKGKGPALVKQNSLTEVEKELGPANVEPTPNFSWEDELACRPTTNTQPSSTTPHPQQERVYHNHPSRSFHGHGNNRGIPLQIETERNPNIPPRPVPANASPTTDTQTPFASSGLMASRHAPKLTGSMASMHAPRPTGLHASMHAPSPPAAQPTGTMASMHAPKPTGSMASMHAPRPSTSAVIDRNRSMHADDPSPPVLPAPSRHNNNNRNYNRRSRGGRSGFRLGSHQVN